MLLEIDNTDIAIHDQAAIRGQSLKNIIIALAAWIILIIVSALIFYFTQHNFAYPEEWILALIRCYHGSEEKMLPNKMFSNIAFIDTGGASAIFGAYFGIMIDAMYL